MQFCLLLSNGTFCIYFSSFWYLFFWSCWRCFIPKIPLVTCFLGQFFEICRLLSFLWMAYDDDVYIDYDNFS